MIDIDKIEAAAKAAPYEAPWRYEPTGQTVWAENIYMVANIRGWGHLKYLPHGEALQDATGVHIATANPTTVLEMVSMIRERDAQVTQLQEQNTMLDAKLAKAEAVLKQALEALECIDSPMYVFEINKVGAAIAAIKGVLEP